MVLSKTVKKQEEVNPNVFLGDYNLSGIPFNNYVNVNDLNFINANVIRDMNRAIILKPITKEKIVEVMVEEIQEKVVCVPQVQVVDRYVEVVKPIIKYKIKEVKRPVTVEKIRKVPKIIEEEKILEVPEIQYVEKFVEVPKIVQKEKIIEIPLPMVRERRIPILNVSRKERFQEIDSVEYKLFNPNDSNYDSSSIEIESSIYSSPIQYEGGEQTCHDCGNECDKQYIEMREGHHNDQSNKGELIVYDVDGISQSQVAGAEQRQQPDNQSLKDIYEQFKETESEQDASKLRYFDSKLANYNSSEGEKQMMDQFSELSSNTYTQNDPQEQYEENKIQIEYGSHEEYPNIRNLSIGGEIDYYEKEKTPESNLERCEEITHEDNKYSEDRLRRERFESRVLISPELESKISKKLIENISTQMIPKSIKILDRKRKLKMENK